MYLMVKVINHGNEYDERNPLNVYGQTKYEGELAVEALDKYFIVRIAWVFGVNGNNFIKTMLRLGKERGAVSVVNDQIGSPTYTYDLSKLVVDMIQTDKYEFIMQLMKVYVHGMNLLVKSLNKQVWTLM